MTEKLPHCPTCTCSESKESAQVLAEQIAKNLEYFVSLRETAADPFTGGVLPDRCAHCGYSFGIGGGSNTPHCPSCRRPNGMWRIG